MSRKNYFEEYSNGGKVVKVVPYDGWTSDFEFITLKCVDAIVMLEAIKDYKKRGYVKNGKIWEDEKGKYVVELRRAVRVV